MERVEDGSLSVCKVTFGGEPKDYEVWEFLLQHYYELKFSPEVDARPRPSAADNPKRRQRSIKKQLQSTGVGTKAQQALAAQREEMGAMRKTVSREQREAEKQRQFALRAQKRKEKHKGH